MHERRNIFFGFSLVVTLAVSVASGATLTRTKIIMGIYATVQVPETNASLVAEAFRILSATEQVFSTYQLDSEVSRLNRDRSLANPSGELRDLLELSFNFTKETEGYFDVTAGYLTEGLYRFKELNEERPEALKALRPAAHLLRRGIRSLGPNGVRIQKQKITLLNSPLQLDFGGIAKGFAIDKVAKFFRDNQVAEGSVALSGDIRCLKSCRVQIPNPFNPDQIFAEFHTTLSDLGISTSGRYERFRGTPQQSHLIDPTNGQPAQGLLSLTLISQSSNARLDALSTGLSVMPIERALRLLHSKSDIGYFMIDKKGQWTMSPNFSTFAKQIYVRPHLQ